MMSFKRILILTGIALGSGNAELLDYDRDCAGCSLREQDSLHVYHRRMVRVNQAGYVPDEIKKAWVMNPAQSEFVLLNEQGDSVWSASLDSIGIQERLGIQVSAFENSIDPLYRFEDSSSASEELWLADFSDWNTPGNYRLISGEDTSALFEIREDLYNDVAENTLWFFGAQRSGENPSWLHGPANTLDGSALGSGREGSLAGGWHDCGVSMKYGGSIGYGALVLNLMHAVAPERDGDVNGSRHGEDPDGIPDLKYEGRIGAEYIFRLYNESVADGLLDEGDMYHSVGMQSSMRMSWVPSDARDTLSETEGGPDRLVSREIGSNFAGTFAAVLALTAKNWKEEMPLWSDSLLIAAADIYDRVMMPKLGTNTGELGGFYGGGGRKEDDEAMAALALWWATGEERFRFDLLENTDIHNNTNAAYAQGMFPAGHLGTTVPFTPGGWYMDQENYHPLVMLALHQLILKNETVALSFGVEAAVRDSLLEDILVNMEDMLQMSTNGSSYTSLSAGGVNVVEPYGLLADGIDWGFNRYNMGNVAMLSIYEYMSGDAKARELVLDNLNFLLGANPWDISFATGAGDRFINHPHHMDANPEFTNLINENFEYWMIYNRQMLKGAVMGGGVPSRPLIDNVADYTVTETCLDFAASALIPMVMVAQDKEISSSMRTPVYRQASAGAVSIFDLRGRRIDAKNFAKENEARQWLQQRSVPGLYILQQGEVSSPYLVH
jgi:hypothetical protein